MKWSSSRLAVTAGCITLASLVLFACSSDDSTQTNRLPAPNSEDGSAASADGAKPPSTTDPADDAGGDAKGPGTTLPPDDDAGAQCTTLPQLGADVDQVVAVAAAPAATGGTIADGVYVLVASRYHTTDFPDGQKLNTLGKITLRIQGGTMRTVFTDDPDVIRESGTLATTAEHAFDFDATCKTEETSGIYVGEQSGTKYTATASTLTLLIAGPLGGTLENVFERRP